MRDIICDVINYCVSSFVMGKIKCYYDQIVIKNLKMKNDGYQTSFINFHLKDDLQMEFMVLWDEMM